MTFLHLTQILALHDNTCFEHILKPFFSSLKTLPRENEMNDCKTMYYKTTAYVS